MDWFSSELLARERAPLRDDERLWLVVATLVAAASRFLAAARTPGEWDEILFCLGMRHYDVAAHHPHPPGFPLFIGMADAIRPLFATDFRALQAINLAASAVVLPSVFLLARELRFRFEVSLGAGLLCSFSSSVWFYGGTAFSDVTSLVLVTAACALLLAGRDHPAAFLSGAFLLGCAISVRPQNVLAGSFPLGIALIAAGRRRWWQPVLAALAIAAVVATSYGLAIEATGWDGWRNAVAVHSEYIRNVDSFLSASRPSLVSVFFTFAVKQHANLMFGYVVTLFVVAGLVSAFRRTPSQAAALLLTFGPFFVFAVLMLDRYSVTRFAIGYSPMFAIFAAEGVHAAAQRGARGDATRARAIGKAILALLIAWPVVWLWPSLREVRMTPSPPIAAAEWIRAHLDPRTATIYTASSLTPFREYFLPEFESVRTIDDGSLPLALPQGREAWLFAEGDAPPGAAGFSRAQFPPLRKVSRHRYISVLVRRADRAFVFGPDWSQPQRHAGEEWREAGAVARIELPASTGLVQVQLLTSAPADLAGHVLTTVRLNGHELGRFTLGQSPERHAYKAPTTLPTMPNVLELRSELTQAAVGSQPGLRLHGLAFERFLR